jgi:hypothetical protein
MPTITGTLSSGAAATLATLRDRVEATLQDSGNLIWSTATLDEAIRRTLDRLNWIMPRQAIGLITLAAAGREISLASLTGLLEVKRVWWNYDSADPAHPPAFCRFEVWPGSILYIHDDSEPAAGDVIRVWYTLPHTIQNLDSASTTTMDATLQALMVTGGAGYAAQIRAIELTEQVTADPGVTNKLNDWARNQIAEFRTQLRNIANIESTRQAQMVRMQPLDRWDNRDDEW